MLWFPKNTLKFTCFFGCGHKRIPAYVSVGPHYHTLSVPLQKLNEHWMCVVHKYVLVGTILIQLIGSIVIRLGDWHSVRYLCF